MKQLNTDYENNEILSTGDRRELGSIECFHDGCPTDKPELLAPAGGREQLIAAINFGADAVYLSGEKFGMRARAANFDDSKIQEAVSLAHSANVKVYVTCNILMHQNDISQLRDYFVFLQKADVDAFIIGDLGAAAVAQEVAPKVALHVSTQASVANAQAAIAWAKMGANRIVLAREMSISQIADLRNELNNYKSDDKEFQNKVNNLQLEAFVHGAMCMSVSGRCLISSYLTDRSANKGHCTQPCRWGYNLIEENRQDQNFPIEEDNFGTYIMNSKDMNMLAQLDKLAAAGITSFKIEGRNKKAMYVSTTVNAYRHVIDAIGDEHYEQAEEKWSQELFTISHRPYSTGFYLGPASQATNYDGYEQETIHVADVVNYDRETNTVTVLCRNHFEEGQTLQAIVPHDEIQEITIKDLKLNNKKVDVANRATEKYTFTCSYPLKSGSLLRAIEFLRTARKA